MAPTSDERREVAARLRDSVNTGEYLDESVVNAILLTMGEVQRPIGSVLADLIDPTCHLVGTTLQTWTDGTHAFHHELSCGHTCETIWAKPPEYCDECGARVVDDG